MFSSAFDHKCIMVQVSRASLLLTRTPPVGRGMEQSAGAERWVAVRGPDDPPLSSFARYFWSSPLMDRRPHTYKHTYVYTYIRYYGPDIKFLEQIAFLSSNSAGGGGSRILPFGVGGKNSMCLARSCISFELLAWLIPARTSVQGSWWSRRLPKRAAASKIYMVSHHGFLGFWLIFFSELRPRVSVHGLHTVRPRFVHGLSALTWHPWFSEPGLFFFFRDLRPRSVPGPSPVCTRFVHGSSTVRPPFVRAHLAPFVVTSSLYLQVQWIQIL